MLANCKKPEQSAVTNFSFLSVPTRTLASAALNAYAALKLDRPGKARSITMLAR